MNKWLELAARCEAATGPDREIDCGIAVLLGWEEYSSGYVRSWLSPEKRMLIVPDWTWSLDAIAALIERKLSSDALSKLMREALTEVGRKYHLHTEIWKPEWGTYTQALVLALDAAFCRAMAAKSPEETPETASSDCK